MPSFNTTNQSRFTLSPVFSAGNGLLKPPRLFRYCLALLLLATLTAPSFVALPASSSSPVPTPAVVAKRHKVSEQTIYNWRKKFGALGTDEVRRLKQLEIENGRLKKLVAERDLEIEVMKEIAAKKW